MFKSSLKGKIGKVELYDMQARLYLNLGVTKEHMEQYKESMDYMERAIKVCQGNDFYELLHKCYMAVGVSFHYKQHDSSRALKFFNLALDVADRLQNKKDKLSETLIAKGEVLIKMADFQSAKKILNQCYKLKSSNKIDRENNERLLRVVAALCRTEDTLITANPSDHRLLKSLYEKMGDGCCKLETYPKAIVYYLKMLENAELNNESGKDLIACYVSLYQTYKDNEMYDLALEYLWKELKLEEDVPKEAFYTFMNIAEIYELQKKHYWDIIKIYENAREIAQKIGDKKLEKLSINKMLSAYKQDGLDSLGDNLRAEAELAGIDLQCQSDGPDDDEDEDKNTQDIGADIDLDQLSDSSSETEDVPKPVRTTRKATTKFIIKKNNKGETQLHQACINGNFSLVERLLEQGHPTNVRDNAGWLPIHEAANYGHDEIVQAILEHGGNAIVNDKGGTKCEGVTPLYDACCNGHFGVIDVLLNHGANSTLQTDFGETPLDALDKWKESARLNDDETERYEKIRARIVKQLQPTGGNIKSKLSSSLPDKDDRNVLNSSNKSLRSLSGRSVINPNMDIDDEENEENFYSPEKALIQEDSSSNDMNLYQSVSNSNVGKRAKSEYQQVMNNLRGKNKSSTGAIRETPTFPTKSAFLKENEVEVDNWLDDDIAPPMKKKRKFSNEVDRLPKLKSPPAKSSTFDKLLYGNENYNSDENSSDAFEVMMGSSRQSFSKARGKSRRSSTKSRDTSPKPQCSLFDAGFSRNISPPPSSSRCSSSLLQYAPADSTNAFNVTAHKSPAKSQIGNVVPVKVKVEEHLFVVPLDSERIGNLNIGWLAEETSTRYYK